MKPSYTSLGYRNVRPKTYRNHMPITVLSPVTGSVAWFSTCKLTDGLWRNQACRKWKRQPTTNIWSYFSYTALWIAVSKSTMIISDASVDTSLKAILGTLWTSPSLPTYLVGGRSIAERNSRFLFHGSWTYVLSTYFVKYENVTLNTSEFVLQEKKWSFGLEHYEPRQYPLAL